MIIVYCQVAIHAGRIRGVLAAHSRVSTTESWGDFTRLVFDATWGVIVLPSLADSSLRCIRQLRPRVPHKPFILVTGKDFDNARHLRDVAVDEVVWLGEEERDLLPAMHRAAGSSRALWRLGAAVEAEVRLPLQLRLALSYACQSIRPITSVRALAMRVRCSTSTLDRQWQLASTERLDLRLEDVVDWVLLLHALAKKQPGYSWDRVADEFGLYRSSLSRVALRATGCSLRIITARGHAATLQQFRTLDLDPLLD